MRPLWYEFPGDEGVYGREGEHMIGDALLVAPILKKSATECKFFLNHYTIKNLEGFLVVDEIYINLSYKIF